MRTPSCVCVCVLSFVCVLVCWCVLAHVCLFACCLLLLVWFVCVCVAGVCWFIFLSFSCVFMCFRSFSSVFGRFVSFSISFCFIMALNHSLPSKNFFVFCSCSVRFCLGSFEKWGQVGVVEYRTPHSTLDTRHLRLETRHSTLYTRHSALDTRHSRLASSEVKCVQVWCDWISMAARLSIFKWSEVSSSGGWWNIQPPFAITVKKR